MRACSRSPTSCSRSPMACSSSVRLCSLASSCGRAGSSGSSGMCVSLSNLWRSPELRERHGPADPVPLCVVDTHPAELIQRGLILNAFGDRLDLELVRDADDRLDDLTVLQVAEQVADELDVDLEVVDRQMPQVGEAAMADAEVIQGKGAAQLAKTHCEGARR